VPSANRNRLRACLVTEPIRLIRALRAWNNSAGWSVLIRSGQVADCQQPEQFRHVVRKWFSSGLVPTGQGGEVGGVQACDEAIGSIAGPGKLAELAGQLEDALPELRGALSGDPGVADDDAQVVRLICRDGLDCRLELGFVFGQLLQAAGRMAAEHQAGVENAAALVTSVFLDATQNRTDADGRR
jgi:hypothetical protein